MTALQTLVYYSIPYVFIVPQCESNVNSHERNEYKYTQKPLPVVEITSC